MAEGEAKAISAVLLISDLVDSTGLAEELGDVRSSAWWHAHDRCARDLIVSWRGREIDKSDGFLLLFECVRDAIGFAASYHAALRNFDTPRSARVGIHAGRVLLRHNGPKDVALGAKAMDIDGASKTIAARIMALARGGQTLLSACAAETAGEPLPQARGHWRLKGIEEPLALYECVDPNCRRLPPQSNAAAYRVHQRDGAWRPTHDQRHTLPAERDIFIGRSRELHALAEPLALGQRLVSLLGPGGSGKTRLALRFGHVWRGDFDGGVWWCDLSAARTLEGVLHAVARGLDLPATRDDPADQIGNALRSRSGSLVILDNFEQVAIHAEETVGRWLSRAPDVRLIVTTRQQLAIAGEFCLAVDPLPPSDGAELFRCRAAAARGRPVADNEQAQADIARLVTLLDGLPLAIELAAARTAVLPLQDLHARLSKRFAVLRRVGGPSGRQHTLETTLDWSWDLLNTVERSTLAQLSVFRGGWSLQSAEAVIDVDGELPPLDALDALRAKSLIRMEESGRFGMLTCVSEYAANQLARALPTSPTMAATERRHARHFASLGEDAATSHHCIEADNLVEACRWATKAGIAPMAAQALQSAWFALLRRGPYIVAAQLGEALAEISDLTTEERVTTFATIGHAYHALGRAADASYWLQKAYSLRHEIDKLLKGRVLCLFGDHLAVSGNHIRAAELLLSARDLVAGEKIQTLHCEIENALGALHFDLARHEEAAYYFRAGLDAARALDHKRWQCGLLGNIAMLDQLANLKEQALIGYRATLKLAEDCGELRWQANAQCNLGLLLNDMGNTAEAEVALELAIKLAKELAQPSLLAASHCNLGLVYMKRSEPKQALHFFLQAREICARFSITFEDEWQHHLDGALRSAESQPH